MTQRRIRVLLTLIVAAMLLLAVVIAVGISGDRYTFAVIGDLPYTAAQEAQLPRWVDQINADPDVALVAHLGDIKSGSRCTDEYLAMIRRQFDRFSDPLVYTPGDNEWTDCHRPAAGGYDPLERLDAVRKVFFDEPGKTLGQHPMRVWSQNQDGYPENVTFTRGEVAFAAVHIVGSNNDLAHWTGQSDPTPAQTAEVNRRTTAAIKLIDDTFDRARNNRNRAVVLLTQADMFDPTDPTHSEQYRQAFQPIVATIAQQARDFNGPVYLFNGDSHVYNVDRPLAGGQQWADFYGIGEPVDNLTRITVDGSTNAKDYLKVTIRPRRTGLLTWQRVPFRS